MRDIFQTVIVGVITRPTPDGKNREVLIGKSNKPKDRALGQEWHIIGGKVDAYEANDKAAIREIKEETGLDVTLDQVICTSTRESIQSDGGVKHTWMVWISCHLKNVTQQPVAGSDISQLKWVPVAQFAETIGRIALERIPAAVRVFLSN